jgi:DNA repair exonuclease SbcCD ATPase subunit
MAMDAIIQWLDKRGGYAAGAALYLEHGQNLLLKRLFALPANEFREYKLRKEMEALVKPKALKQPLSSSASTVIAMANLPEQQKISSLIQLDPKELEELKDQVKDQEWTIEQLEDEKSDLQDTLDDLEYDHQDLTNDYESLKEEAEKLKKAAKYTPRGWPPVMDATMQQLHDQWLPLFVEKKNLQSRIHDIATAGETNPDKKTEAGAMAHRILDLRDSCRSIYVKRDHYLEKGVLPDEPKPYDLEIPTDANKWPLTLANYQRYVRQYKNKLAKRPDNKNFQHQLERYEWGVAQIKKLLGI